MYLFLRVRDQVVHEYYSGSRNNSRALVTLVRKYSGTKFSHFVSTAERDYSPYVLLDRDVRYNI